jgi:putative peptidoglycan lipid II flippase
LSAVAGNIVWNFVTFRHFGHVGLALGTSVAALLNVAVLLIAFQRRVGGLFDRSFASASLRIFVASAVMGALVWSLSWLFETHAGHSRLQHFAAALVPVSVGGAAYLVLAKFFRLDEGRAILRRRRRATGVPAATPPPPTSGPNASAA